MGATVAAERRRCSLGSAAMVIFWNLVGAGSHVSFVFTRRNCFYLPVVDDDISRVHDGAEELSDQYYRVVTKYGIHEQHGRSDQTDTPEVQRQHGCFDSL